MNVVELINAVLEHLLPRLPEGTATDIGVSIVLVVALFLSIRYSLMFIEEKQLAITEKKLTITERRQAIEEKKLELEEKRLRNDLLRKEVNQPLSISNASETTQINTECER
ncbi:hypothetical protein IEE_04435 [Bacillus cereus BAG5X1-1]|uniref:Uncharacterized protein n=1 Tax=Bacillus cereus BAG5X1-1 TaxID=1053189 RepID=J8AR39_BACCE|nr:hypothetical protein [Bacillus cereus]EJQ41945.1 hypothetical protein IEE_04435 [Bacillus cereus BAG5X1-1]PGY15425.1 hypothetical protein COE23_10940 [Bacillus cereus]